MNPAAAVPTLHERLHQTRREANRYREIAELFAAALDAEVNARFEARGVDVRAVHAHTAYCLRLARTEGLILEPDRRPPDGPAA